MGPKSPGITNGFTRHSDTSPEEMGKHDVNDLTLFYLDVLRRYTVESSSEKRITLI